MAGLNPHAGEAGLFGDEETQHIRPAIAAARARGLDVSDPLPGDTVFLRAVNGEFDIVGTGRARPDSLLAAIDVACQLVAARQASAAE